MLPNKQWFKEFKKQLEKAGLIDELELQRKYTTSWSQVSFTIPPLDAAFKVNEFAVSVNRLISDEIIDHDQGYKYIMSVLMDMFSFQFSIFFVLVKP